jgi:hypothetical protein
MNEEAIKLAKEWGNALAEAIGKYGPDAARLAETIVRLDVASTIATALVVLACGSIGLHYARALYTHARALPRDRYDDMKDEATFKVIASVVGGGISTLMVLVGVVKLSNPILWFSLWEPKVWIAAKLLKL